VKHTALSRARAKVQHNTGREYYAHLTPSDVLILAKAGAQFKREDLTRAEVNKRTGDSGGRWHYFEVPDAWKASK
jgi:hypothetical protein